MDRDLKGILSVASINRHNNIYKYLYCKSQKGWLKILTFILSNYQHFITVYTFKVVTAIQLSDLNSVGPQSVNLGG